MPSRWYNLIRRLFPLLLANPKLDENATAEKTRDWSMYFPGICQIPPTSDGGADNAIK